MMIDAKAPIVPWEGLGGIKLYSTIRDMRELIENEAVKGEIYHNTWVRYEIEGLIDLFFHLTNGKLFKIIGLENYEGKLFDKIGIGMTETELVDFDPSFIYEDFEEVFISDKGVFIETDPITREIIYISVFIKELDDEDFDNGDW